MTILYRRTRRAIHVVLAGIAIGCGMLAFALLAVA